MGLEWGGSLDWLSGSHLFRFVWLGGWARVTGPGTSSNTCKACHDRGRRWLRPIRVKLEIIRLGMGNQELHVLVLPGYAAHTVQMPLNPPSLPDDSEEDGSRRSLWYS